MRSGAKVRTHSHQTFVHTHRERKKRENFSATQSQQRIHQERTFGFFCVNPLLVDGESERENSNLWNLEDLRSAKEKQKCSV